MSNIDTVNEMYGASGSGDIPAIIDKLDPNVEWDVEIPTPGVPWLQPRRGAANVPAFFESLAPISFQRFEPHTFFADGNKVLRLCSGGRRKASSRFVPPAQEGSAHPAQHPPDRVSAMSRTDPAEPSRPTAISAMA